MKRFNGFPARMQFTAIPNLFFSNILPQIEDMAELKTTLYLFRLIYGKKGYPRFLTYKELLGNKSLVSSLGGETSEKGNVLSNALELAVKRGTILHLVMDMDGQPEDIYFLNTDSDRKVVERIQNGELALTGLKAAGHPQANTDFEDLPDIFTLYEQNIGMLTPMIAEELGEAEKMYPEDWIRDAIKEAVSLNKRNWRYIARILENWSAEGKSDGTHKRDSKKGPDKYNGQKYGHLFQR
ncbi:DnaD domain-containing protein [Chloroflexota bacterium]